MVGPREEAKNWYSPMELESRLTVRVPVSVAGLPEEFKASITSGPGVPAVTGPEGGVAKASWLGGNGVVVAV